MRNPSQAKENTIEHEGRKRKLYKDSEGILTIGIGNALPTVTAALAWKSWAHFDGTPATESEIRAAFARVTAEKTGYAAEHYEPLTPIQVSDEEIDQVWDRTLAAFEAGLVRVFPAFESWPEGPQLGAFDIEYQAGEGGLRHGFPHLVLALNSNPPDFHRAAIESHRSKSSPKRNADTAALFESGVSSPAVVP